MKCKENTVNCVQLLYKRQLLTFTFAWAQILIDENLQLSICFNQTSLQRNNNLINLEINIQDITIVKLKQENVTPWRKIVLSPGRQILMLWVGSSGQTPKCQFLITWGKDPAIN